MAIDRSKFKASSVTKMQEADQELNDQMGRTGSRAGMLKIKDGKNKYRIYPAHPEDSLPEDEQPGFSQPSVKTFLPMMVDEKDQTGKLTGKKKESSKPVFNSRIHGNTPKDLVEEYIKLARKIAESAFDNTEKGKADKQSFLDLIYGKYSPVAAQRIMGINYKTAHVMYADEILGETRNFGRLEVKDSVKVSMNKISATESADEPLGMDPFTDLDDGRAVVINFDKTAKVAANYYTTTLDSDTLPDKKTLKFYPITDELLEEFEKQPTLLSMYVNVFKRKDFELQIEGLEFFDQKNQMGICDRPEWSAILEEIDGYYGGDAQDAPSTDQQGSEQEEPDEPLTEGDEFSEMSRIQLKTYIAKKTLGIVIKPSYSDAQIADLIRDRIKENGEGEPDELESKISSKKPEEIKEAIKTTSPVGTSRLSALRKRVTS